MSLPNPNNDKEKQTIISLLKQNQVLTQTNIHLISQISDDNWVSVLAVACPVGAWNEVGKRTGEKGKWSKYLLMCNCVVFFFL